METKHTPGPWEVIGGYDQQLFYVGGSNNVCDIHRGARAEKYGDGRFSRRPCEDEANARLIAAAPDLLEACKAAQRVFAAWEKDANPHGDLQDGDSADLDAARLMLKMMNEAIPLAQRTER